jgi:hypothetical protein
MNLLLIIVVIVQSFLTVYCYRLGLADGQKKEKGLDIIVKNEDEKPKEPTRKEIIFSNIENYSGDESGQVEVV